MRVGNRVKSLWAFTAENDGELSVEAGKEMIILEINKEWLKCQLEDNSKLIGFIPASYVEELQQKKVPPVVPPKKFRQPGLASQSSARLSEEIDGAQPKV